MIDLLLRNSSDKLVVPKSGKKKTTTKLFKKMTLNSFAEREKEMKEKKHALPDATSLSAWHNAAWHNAAQCGTMRRPPPPRRRTSRRTVVEAILRPEGAGS